MDDKKQLALEGVVAVIAPLIVASVVAVATIMWGIEPTIARHSERLEVVEAEADESRQLAKEANERQIEIRIELSAINEKLDQMAKDDKDRHDERQEQHD